MNFGHDANMGRTPKERQRKIRLPYSNWPCFHGSAVARRLAGWRMPDDGAEAYSEARQRERDVVLPDGTTHAGRTPAHWRRVALVVARMRGKQSASTRRQGCWTVGPLNGLDAICRHRSIDANSRKGADNAIATREHMTDALVHCNYVGPLRHG